MAGYVAFLRAINVGGLYAVFLSQSPVRKPSSIVPTCVRLACLFMTSSRWSRRGAILNLIAGGVSGAVFLGVGGRIAMWVFALATNRPPVVTLFGSVRVVFYGGIIGLLLGLLRWMVAPLLRGPRWVRGLEFGALALLVCIPGIRPPTLLNFSLFTPLFIAYGVLLEEVLRRRSMASNPLIC